MDHINIVKFYKQLETANNYYMFQEYCDGDTLTNMLKKRITLPEEEALQVLKQILNGFVYLCKNGIIHRDIKPDNILI
jgi:serine/threonine protein kinase